MKIDNWSIERLLSTSNLNEDEKNYIINIYDSLDIDNEFDLEKIQELNHWIFDSQIDPITSGFNYGQNDILRHLKNLR